MLLEAATFGVLPPHSREAWRRCPPTANPSRRAEGAAALAPPGGGRGRRGEAQPFITGAAQTRPAEPARLLRPEPAEVNRILVFC